MVQYIKLNKTYLSSINKLTEKLKEYIKKSKKEENLLHLEKWLIIGPTFISIGKIYDIFKVSLRLVDEYEKDCE
jgi:hypothetical protein